MESRNATSDDSLIPPHSSILPAAAAETTGTTDSGTSVDYWPVTVK